MTSFFDELLGLEATAATLTTAQTCARAVVVFLAALVLLRISGRRTFASNTALDMVVKFMIGAVLSRAIVGDAAMSNTFAAATTLVVVQRVLGYATYYFPALAHLVKGRSSVLVENAQVQQQELRRACLSEEDMRAGVRASANLDDLAETETVRLEHDGSISVVKKKKG